MTWQKDHLVAQFIKEPSNHKNLLGRKTRIQRNPMNQLKDDTVSIS
jgi:hypothetical protein